MGFCTKCGKPVRDIHRHQRRLHPLDYRPPPVKGEQFRCIECQEWYAFSGWSSHYKVVHGGELPPNGRPKPGEDGRRSAAEANKTKWIEYAEQLRGKGHKEREIREAATNIDEESQDSSAVPSMNENSTPYESQSQRSPIQAASEPSRTFHPLPNTEIAGPSSHSGVYIAPGAESANKNTTSSESGDSFMTSQDPSRGPNAPQSSQHIHPVSDSSPKSQAVQAPMTYGENALQPSTSHPLVGFHTAQQPSLGEVQNAPDAYVGPSSQDEFNRNVIQELEQLKSLAPRTDQLELELRNASGRNHQLEQELEQLTSLAPRTDQLELELRNASGRNDRLEQALRNASGRNHQLEQELEQLKSLAPRTDQLELELRNTNSRAIQLVKQIKNRFYVNDAQIKQLRQTWEDSMQDMLIDDDGASQDWLIPD